MNEEHDQAQTFKQSAREIIEHSRLSDIHINNLLDLQKELLDDDALTTSCAHKESRLAILSQTGIQKIVGVGFVAVLAIAISFWINTPSNYSKQIAAEVIKNHLKLKPLDVQAQSFSKLRRFFTALDFLPIRSSFAQKGTVLRDKNLIGGRYCSIKGVTAAQIRYRNLKNSSSTSISTLYQVDYDKDLYGYIPHLNKGSSPTVITMKGLEVSLWVEKGLLMVLVSELS